MGLYGDIVLFPTAGTPPTDPDSIARRAIEAFERLDLLVPGTASVCEPPRPWVGRFAQDRKIGTLAEEDYAIYVVKPERVRPALRKLVYLSPDWLARVQIGLRSGYGAARHAPTELPWLEFSVIRKSLPIFCSYDKRTIGTTWATVEFDYEDVRYNPRIHRIRDAQHPIFAALADGFSSPISWDVDIG